MKRYTTIKLSKRAKQLKRIKQLKRSLANTKEELENINTCRMVARRELCYLKNFFIEMSRAASDLNARKYWLRKTRPINLFLSLSTSKEEFDQEWDGKDIYPEVLKYTDEEHELLKKEQNND